MKYFGITLLPPTGDIKEEGRESARDEHLALKAQNEQKLVFIILKEGAVASIKVLIQLFQKLAGVEGTASLIEARKPRNTQDFIKSSFFRFLFSSLKEKRKNNILETINSVSQITCF